MEFNALIPEFAVTDIAASLDFYVGRLGFTLDYERPREGFAFLSLGGAQLMLDQIGLGRTFRAAPLEPPLGRGCNLQISVDPELYDGLLGALDAAGTPLFLAPEEKNYARGPVEYRRRQFVVADPDGYLLRFSCAAGSGEKES